jgi:hypothetical protein
MQCGPRALGAIRAIRRKAGVRRPLSIAESTRVPAVGPRSSRFMGARAMQRVSRIEPDRDLEPPDRQTHA